MIHKSPNTLAIAAGSIALLYPQMVRAQSQAQGAVNPQDTSNVTTSDGKDQAMQMVPAQAKLIGSLDARKAQPGQEVRAALSSTVHLKNGPELPRGTNLIGTANADTTQHNRRALVLSFTKAELKNGTVVPVKAIIVGAAEPQESSPSMDRGTADVSPWDGVALQVDNVNVLSGGIDLHSNIASSNSGTFVATKKDDVKLPSGSQLALAMSAQGSGQQEPVGGLQ
jgi:hypothetical protein